MSRLLSRCIVAWLIALPAGAFAQDMVHDMPGMSMPMPMPPSQDAPNSSGQHAAHGASDTDSRPLPANDHVPPPPPQITPHAMTPSQMNAMMQMDDDATLGMFALDRLERGRSTAGDDATRWEAEAWIGHPIDRLWLKAEGERDDAGTQDVRIEALWSHAWTSFWDTQLGIRHDAGHGPDRQWLAFGVEGLAPYWFETQATFYVGEQGRTALRLETSYDMRFTQRLILAPQLELNVYGKDDPRRGVSSGLSSVEAGLRLRYEFSRKLAPYVGVDWTRRFGRFDDVPGMTPMQARETMWVAGVRLWL